MRRWSRRREHVLGPSHARAFFVAQYLDDATGVALGRARPSRLLLTV
jgi:hypothetical protein